MNSSEALIKSLENEGVQYIFGLAGEENLHLLEAIRGSKITYIPVRHEQAAGFMAATIGRLTGKIGVALSTLGPGATNLVTAIAYAKLGAMPSFFITGQKPIRNNPQGNFQLIDITRLMEPIVKRTTTVLVADKVPYLVREFARTAEEERPGPVHLELPKDVSNESTSSLPMEYDHKVRRPIAEAKAVAKAVEMILAAKNPLILIGASANRKLTSKMLTEFVDTTNICFVDTQMGKGVVREDHPNFIGTTATTAAEIFHNALEKADLIINVGHDIIEKSPFLMKRESNQQVIHINYFGAEVHEYYFPQLEVIGDIANSVWQILEGLRAKNYHFEGGSEFKAVRERMLKEVFAQAENWKDAAAHKSLLARHIVGVVRDFLDPQDILSLDNGMYKLWFARYYRALAQNTILLDNALATMGAGLPAGIAAKLINPDKRVLVVTGDGGFMLNSQELETAVRLRQNLTVLLINDNGLGMIRWEQEEKEYPDFGLTNNNPDFLKYAESFGAKGYRAKNPQELFNALQAADKAGGVCLIEALVDYSENAKIFNLKH